MDWNAFFQTYKTEIVAILVGAALWIRAKAAIIAAKAAKDSADAAVAQSELNSKQLATVDRKADRAALTAASVEVKLDAQTEKVETKLANQEETIKTALDTQASELNQHLVKIIEGTNGKIDDLMGKAEEIAKLKQDAAVSEADKAGFDRGVQSEKDKS